MQDTQELTPQEQIDRLLEKERELFERYQLLAQAALLEVGIDDLRGRLADAHDFAEVDYGDYRLIAEFLERTALELC